MGSGLTDLQRLVAEAALRPRALAGDVAIVARANGAIAGGARMTPVEQLDVYREQFWLRHVKSLEDDFTIARHFAGEEAFFQLVAAYFAARPPSSFDLRGLGAELPAFAAERAPFDDAMLRESMRLDWAFMEAFDAPARAPFNPASLAEASEDVWPRAKIAFDPSVRPLALAWPLHETRAAIRRGEGGAIARPEQRPAFVVVHRRGDHLYCAEIEPDAFALLEALRAGAELGAACEAVANGRDASELGERVGAWFQSWTSSGWVSAIAF